MSHVILLFYVVLTWLCASCFRAGAWRRNTWIARGYKAVAFDIKNNPLHDVTSKPGFLMMLDYGLALLSSSFRVAKCCIVSQ